MSFLRGFTLIELLVVITIVGILSTVAIPAYDRYIVKAHIVEILSVADSYKVKLIEDTVTAASATNTVYNVDVKVIDKINVFTLDTDPITYVIEATAKMKTPDQAGIGLKQPKNSKQPLMLQLRGIPIGEAVFWSCHVAAEYNDYVPATCKNNDLETFRSA
ncbi:MAG TPA: prepilin-type N-terminal cleavage/methylation domain-containing protein [Gammaproteobacteria bacterium]|nr:prepilin-type N-terminal cleavage/methylation domain-containing protein [Gammaproteobacteria bacterium]